MKWKEFLEKLMKDWGRLTPYDLENKTGIKQSTWHRILSGESGSPRSSTINALEVAFKIKIDDSDPENITYKKIEETADNKTTFPSLPFLEDMAPVNVYGFIHAGNEGPIFSEDVIEQILIPKSGYTDLYGIVVDGDSMEPVINNRDIVVVSLNAKASDGDVCMVAYNDHDYVVKRVFFNKDIDLVTLVSDNKKYPPAFVPTSKIRSILPIVGLYKGRNSLRSQG